MKSSLMWFANFAMMFAMISLLSPKVAAEAATPWVAFFVANMIYLYDSARHKNWPWFSMCTFCSIWNGLLIASRTVNEHLFDFLIPVITFLEKLP